MRYVVITALGLLLVIPPLAAQRHVPVGVERPAVMERWLGLLDDSERALVVGEWKKARKITEDVLSEMCNRIEGGEGVANLLGTAALLRSLAEAGLGNEAAANWDFATAQTLVPKFSKIDLGRFAAAGEMLEPWRFRDTPANEGAARDPKVIRLKDDKSPKDDLTPPRKRHAPQPKYPFAKFQACVDGPIVIQAVIDKQGQPINPRLLTTQDPVLGFAALEALRDWRFKPARLNGKPITVYYNLTVNFEVPRCENLFALAKQAESEG